MNKKFTTLATSVFVALLVSAFAFTVVGCGDPEAGPAGSSGGAGAGGPIFLKGAITQLELDAALETGADVYIVAPATSSGLVIKSGKTVKLVGSPALTDGGVLTVLGNLAGSGTAKATILLVRASEGAAPDANIAGGTNTITAAALESDGTIPASGVYANYAAILGNITIKDAATDAGDVKRSAISTKTVFVIGDVTIPDAGVTDPVAAAITATGSVSVGTATATNITAGGDVSLGAALTGSVSTDGALSITAANAGLAGIDAGSLTSTKAVESSATINVKGDLILSATAGDGALTTTTNSTAILVGGNLTAASVATAGTTAGNPGSVSGGPALKVGGKVTITGELATAAASIVEFNGGSAAEPSKIGTIAQAGDLDIAGSGHVTVGEVGATNSNNVIIKNTAGVTITAATVIAASTDSITATKATFVGTSGTGIKIDSDATSITVPVGGKIIVAGEGASLVSAPADTTSITFTETDFNAGTYSPDSASFALGAGASIVVYSTGKITLVGAQILEVAQNVLSNITLLAGAELVGSATSLIQENGSDGAGVTLKAETADGTGAADDKLVVTEAAGPPKTFTITTAGTGTAGDVIVGTSLWAIAGTVAKGTGVDSDTKQTANALAGVLKAGANTNLILCGSV